MYYVAKRFFALNFSVVEMETGKAAQHCRLSVTVKGLNEVTG